MTDPSDRLPEDFQEKIGALESELGREICGFPNEDFEPCELWPADDSDRCSRHAGSDLDEFLQEHAPSEEKKTYSITPEETLKTPSTAAHSTPPQSPLSELFDTLRSSALYWSILVFLGVLIGSGVAALTVDFKSTTVKTTNAPDVQINIDDPNFNRIRELYRNGQYSRVVESLGTIVEEAPNRRIRARGLYYSYVFHQKQKNYERALGVADQFLREYPDHHRRAEILYGAWFISSQFLDNSRRAESYRETLLEEFPESKWAQRLTS